MRSGEVGGGEVGPSHKGVTSVALYVHAPPQNPFLLTQEYLIMNLSQSHRRATGPDSPPLRVHLQRQQGLPSYLWYAEKFGGWLDPALLYKYTGTTFIRERWPGPLTPGPRPACSNIRNTR